MPADAFATDSIALWQQLRPLYVSLHAYVRGRLREKYGGAVPENGSDPRAPARQHLAAGLVEHLPAGRAARRGAGPIR